MALYFSHLKDTEHRCAVQIFIMELFIFTVSLQYQYEKHT